MRTFEFMKGFSWGFPGQRGEFEHPEAKDSLQALRKLGAEWITICFGARMDTLQSTVISFGDEEKTMVTDDEIRHVVAMAHELGFKVILKPMVETRAGEWRALIEFNNEQDLDAWWQSFGEFLTHYACIAEQTGSEIFCLGCEMRSMERFDERWRNLASRVRGIYTGLMTYNANHDSILDVGWWEIVDLISVSAYYAVGNGPDSTVEEMRASWEPVRDKLARLASETAKPVFFIEIGVMSSRGCSLAPAKWDSDEPLALNEQASYYEAALGMFWEEQWFAGFFWWKWDARLSLVETSSKNSSRAKIIGDRGFRIAGKPAEQVLRQWYTRPRRPASDEIV